MPEEQKYSQENLEQADEYCRIIEDNSLSRDQRAHAINRLTRLIYTKQIPIARQYFTPLGINKLPGLSLLKGDPGHPARIIAAAVLAYRAAAMGNEIACRHFSLLFEELNRLSYNSPEIRVIGMLISELATININHLPWQLANLLVTDIFKGKLKDSLKKPQTQKLSHLFALENKDSFLNQLIDFSRNDGTLYKPDGNPTSSRKIANRLLKEAKHRDTPYEETTTETTNAESMREMVTPSAPAYEPNDSAKQSSEFKQFKSELNDVVQRLLDLIFLEPDELVGDVRNVLEQLATMTANSHEDPITMTALHHRVQVIIALIPAITTKVRDSFPFVTYPIGPTITQRLKPYDHTGFSKFIAYSPVFRQQALSAFMPQPGDSTRTLQEKFMDLAMKLDRTPIEAVLGPFASCLDQWVQLTYTDLRRAITAPPPAYDANAQEQLALESKEPQPPRIEPVGDATLPIQPALTNEATFDKPHQTIEIKSQARVSAEQCRAIIQDRESSRSDKAAVAAHLAQMIEAKQASPNPGDLRGFGINKLPGVNSGVLGNYGYVRQVVTTILYWKSIIHGNFDAVRPFKIHFNDLMSNNKKSAAKVIEQIIPDLLKIDSRNYADFLPWHLCAFFTRPSAMKHIVNVITDRSNKRKYGPTWPSFVYKRNLLADMINFNSETGQVYIHKARTRPSHAMAPYTKAANDIILAYANFQPDKKHAQTTDARTPAAEAIEAKTEVASAPPLSQIIQPPPCSSQFTALKTECRDWFNEILNKLYYTGGRHTEFLRRHLQQRVEQIDSCLETLHDITKLYLSITRLKPLLNDYISQWRDLSESRLSIHGRRIPRDYRLKHIGDIWSGTNTKLESLLRKLEAHTLHPHITHQRVAAEPEPALSRAQPQVHVSERPEAEAALQPRTEVIVVDAQVSEPEVRAAEVEAEPPLIAEITPEEQPAIQRPEHQAAEAKARLNGIAAPSSPLRAAQREQQREERSHREPPAKKKKRKKVVRKKVAAPVVMSAYQAETEAEQPGDPSTGQTRITAIELSPTC